MKPLKAALIADSDEALNLVMSIASDELEISFSVQQYGDNKRNLDYLNIENHNLILLASDDRKVTEKTIGELLKSIPRIPIIVLSKGLDERTSLNFLSNGADDCIDLEQIDRDSFMRRLRLSVERFNKESIMTETNMRASPDISKRLIKERVSENLFNLPVEMFSIMDFDGYFVQLNPAWHKTLGWTEKEMLTRPWMEFIYPEDKNASIQVFEKLKTGDMVYGFENRFSCKDASYCWLAWNYFPLKEENLIFSVARNITQRKKALNDLQTLSIRYETILAEIPNIVVEVDENKRYVWMNRAGLDFFGEEAIGREAADFFTGEQKTYKVIQPLFIGKENTIYFESYQRRKDGKKRLLAWWCRPLKNNKGETFGALSVAQDITEIKEAELKLKQSEEKYKDLVEQINDVVFATDVDGRMTYISPVVKQITGYLPSEIIGRFFFEFVFPDDLKKLTSMFKKKFSGLVESFEFRILKKEGEPVWVRTSSRQAKKDNIVIGLHGIMTDIRERKLAEEALKESEERFRISFQTSPDSININRLKDGLFLYTNDGFTELTGYTREDIIGKTSLDISIWNDPRDRQRLIDGLMKDGYVKNLEANFRLKNGSVRTGLMSVKILRINNENCSLSVTRDIDDWKKAENLVQEEKELLSVTLRSIGDGVITIDLNGRVLFLNKVAEDLTGWKSEEAVGLSIWDVFNLFNEKTGKKYLDMVEKIISNKLMDVRDNFVLISKSGEERFIGISTAQIKDLKGETIGGVVVFRDITVKLRMEEDLQNAQKLESIGILAGGIAHDFNNILAAILANVALAKAAVHQNKKAVARLTEAEKAVSRAQGLTQQLLTFSKGGAPIKEVSDIKDLLFEIVTFTLAGSKSKPEFDIADELYPVEVDKGQFSQVINNLVINALQAMPEGGIVRVRAKNISIRSDNSLMLKEGDYARISIEDCGIGIPQENISKIFDPYFTTKDNGYGLGLAMVYSIIKRHNGEIKVQSKPGVITVFDIYLPASKTEIGASKKTERTIIKGEGKVLLMDDKDAILEATKEVLQYLGYSTTLVKDGKTMLDIYKMAKEESKPFDVVILDLTIPGGLGGIEAVKKLLQIDPKVKVIASSGYSNDPVMANYKDYGFSGILPKPFTLVDMSQVLNKIIRDKKE